jgi:hypothetical protein
MIYAQYIQKFLGNSGWLSQNPHGWFEFTLTTHSDKRETFETAELKGRTFESEHIITEVHDDFVVVTNKKFTVFSRSIPLSLFVLQYIERG